MSVGLVVAISFFVLPILAGVATGFISDLSERPTKAQIASYSYTTKINKPNFKETHLVSGENEVLNGIPDFESFNYHEEIPQYINSYNEEAPQLMNNYDEIDLVADYEYPRYEQELMQNEIIEVTTQYQHSNPSANMEKGIVELLAAVTIPENDNIIPFKKNQEQVISMNTDDSLITDDLVPPMLEELNDEINSVLGDNYYFVASNFGPNVANMVTATPDSALEAGVPYVLFGKIEGKFLNSFGESIELIGLPKNYETKNEFVLLNGNFVTADIFNVIDTMSAESASKGEEFEVLNVAFA